MKKIPTKRTSYAGLLVLCAIGGSVLGAIAWLADQLIQAFIHFM